MSVAVEVPAATSVLRLAQELRRAFVADVPADVLERAAVQVFDALACAAGAQDAPPVAAARAVTAGSGPATSTVFFDGTRLSALDAVLVNGTAVRYLDYNDAYIGSGPGGHPSDNIVAALAVGEEVGASGHEVLTTVALGYELFWRFRQTVYARTQAGAPWDGVSVSAVVCAAMAGLLRRQDAATLGHALSIGLAKGYALKQLRRGSISMVKASANAMVARDGVLAAALAGAGLTGPAEILEGREGVLRAFGVEADVLDGLVAPPDWAIRRISIKPFPAIATSQAALHAACTIAAAEGFDASAVDEVVVRLPDSKATREHLDISQRQWPDSRESADHSLPFLMAAALMDGDLSLAQFEGDRWLDPGTTALMARVRVVPDASLASHGQVCYPAVVTVRTASGRTLIEEVAATPGSPEAPWGFTEVATKLRKVACGLEPDTADRLAGACAGLPTASDLSTLVTAVGGTWPPPHAQEGTA